MESILIRTPSYLTHNLKKSFQGSQLLLQSPIDLSSFLPELSFLFLTDSCEVKLKFSLKRRYLLMLQLENTMSFDKIFAQLASVKCYYLYGHRVEYKLLLKQLTLTYVTSVFSWLKLISRTFLLKTSLTESFLRHQFSNTILIS